MKRQILDARKKMVSSVIRSSGGIRLAASRLGMKQKKFENHAFQNCGSSPLTDFQIHQLENMVGTTHYPAYIAGIYGGLFVQVADPETLDNVELYARSVQVAAKRGTVDQIIAQSLEDGSISMAESKQILSAHKDHMAARHGEVLAAINLFQAPESAQ
ncbi:hypothetical protein PSCICO_15190 [Pseudomonas cichorii]|uniref:YmfL family putative regulatory protein n=1 Tax=Pseudomonas cichorii TaxID=36746 RepID=UPI00190FE3E0|nr:YmfL family putative regulatory protein [Pseudomonas cichorii]GFM86120.1 hypothetical protein PSCICO_15190 [Pseudomonas cichorii]